MKKFLLLVIAGTFVLGIWYYDYSRQRIIKLDLPAARDYQVFVSDPKRVNNHQSSSTPTAINLDYPVPTASGQNPLGVSASMNLDIPFTAQAPTADWSQPWQDACEEASLLMVDYYYQNKDLPDPASVENILGKVVRWQEENWGGHEDLPVARVAELADQYFSMTAEVIEDITADQIRQYLDRGLPVIVPADGHKLANPFFSGDGPDYHMLVIKGYVGDKFITNDPGTKRGADFIYTEENLLDSIHDWDASRQAAEGPRRGLLIYENK